MSTTTTTEASVSKPIGIYVRVSSKGTREDEKFHSPKEQAERATALLRAKGYQPGPVFEDINVSGAKAPAERPAMGRLLADIKAGKLGGIAAFSLDRLSREPAHGDALVKAVTKAGGIVLTPDIPEAIDSPTGEFTFGMLLQVAKLYRATAGARFASAKERATKAGIPVADPPLGYRRGADRRLELDPDMAPVVRELFERRAAGETYTPLARWLTERIGRRWTVSGVATLVRNRLYATGRLTHGQWVSDHAAKPVVDEALWHAAQIVAPRPRPSRSEGKWLLTGLLRCAGCGRALSVQRGAATYPRDPRRGNFEPVVRTPEQVPRRYRCRSLDCTSKGNVEAGRLERWVVLRSFERGDELATVSEAPDLGALEDAAAVAERRLAQASTPEAMDALGDAWAATVKERRQERDAAQAALGTARTEAGVPARLLRLRDVWDDLSQEDKRAALSLYWKVIRVGHAPRGTGGTPLTFVARGPQEAEAHVVLPTTNDTEEAA